MKTNLYFKYFLCFLLFTGVFLQFEGCSNKTPASGDSTDDPSGNSSDDPTDNPTDVPTDVPSPSGTEDYFIDANNHCIGKVLTKISDDRYQVISPKGYVTDISSTHFNILKGYISTKLTTETSPNAFSPDIKSETIEPLDNGIWKDYKDKLYQQALFYMSGGNSGDANAFYDYQEEENQNLSVNNNKSQPNQFQGVTPKLPTSGSASHDIDSILIPSKKVKISNKQQVLDDTGFLVDWTAPAAVVEEDANYVCEDHQ